MRPFSFLLFFVVAVAMTTGLYLTIRKPQDRKVDSAKLLGLFRPIAQRNRQLTEYLFKILRGEPAVPTNRSTKEANAPAV